MSVQRHRSKARRHRDQRHNRKVRHQLNDISQEQFYLADNNPMGFITGGNSHRWMMELCAEYDRIERTMR
jgi:hypothetical protein